MPNSPNSQTPTQSPTSSSPTTEPATGEPATGVLFSDPSADPISDVFSRDHTTWTDGDMDRMIAHLRDLRGELGENQAPVKKAKAAPASRKKYSADVSTADLLKDLGLD